MYAFVVPTYDKPWLSAKCVQTLMAHEPPGDWFVVVVNDGARPPAPESIRRQFEGNPKVEVILRPSNEGFSRTCNAGIRRALERGATRILLVNDDIEFTIPVIPALDLAFSSSPRVGVVGARLLYPDGTLQHAGMARSGKMIGHRYYRLPGDHPSANVPRESAVTGALMAISADTVREIGPLDEGYFMTCEDTDYCVTAARAGWKVLYWPQFSAIHAEGATRGRTSREKSEKYRSAELLGYSRLYGRWGHEVKEVVRVGPRARVYWCVDPADAAGTELALSAAGALAARGWDCEIWSTAPVAPRPWTLSPSPVIMDGHPDMAAALADVRGIKVAASPSLAGAVRASVIPGDRGFALALGAEDAITDLRPLCPSRDLARELGLRGSTEPAYIGWCVPRAILAGPIPSGLGAAVVGQEGLLDDASVFAEWTPDCPNRLVVFPHAGTRQAGMIARAMGAGHVVVAPETEAARALGGSGQDLILCPRESVAERARSFMERARAVLADDPFSGMQSRARAAIGRHQAWHVTADHLESIFDRPDPKPEPRRGPERSMARTAPTPSVYASRRRKPPPEPQAPRRKEKSLKRLGGNQGRPFTSRHGKKGGNGPA